MTHGIQFARPATATMNYYEGFASTRDYFGEVTSEDKSHLAYLINSLANKSYLSLLIIRHSIQSAGDKTAHIHPLRFLLTIFSDEELKVGMRNMKGIPWDEFSKGIKDSLEEEKGKNNILPEHIDHFASSLNLNKQEISGLINRRDWDRLFTILKDIPRQGNYKRYDM